MRIATASAKPRNDVVSDGQRNDVVWTTNNGMKGGTARGLPRLLRSLAMTWCATGNAMTWWGNDNAMT